MTRHVARNLAGTSLALLGLAIVLVELARYWRFDHPIHPWPVIIGGSIAVFGAYVLDPKTTQGGGTFIVDQASRIVAVIRTGRRSTDAVAVKDDGSSEMVHVSRAVQMVHVDPMELPMDLPPEEKP